MNTGRFTVNPNDESLNPSRVSTFRQVLLDGAVGASLFKGRLPSNPDFQIALPPRHSRLLVAVVEARGKNQGTGRENRDGWRTRKQLARAIEVSWGYRVSASTITAYASQLATMIREPLRTNGIEIEILERRRGFGIRLAPGVSIELVDDDEEPAAEEPTNHNGRTSSDD